MRISDWSSDVCSSDLADIDLLAQVGHVVAMWPPAQQVAHQRCLVPEYLAREPVVHGVVHGCDISAVGGGCGRKTADLLRVLSSFVWRGNSIEGDRTLGSDERRVGKACVSM